MYTLLKSAGIPKEAVKPYSSIPLALFKRESECLRIFNILPNLVQNRKTKEVAIFICCILIWGYWGLLSVRY